MLICLKTALTFKNMFFSETQLSFFSRASSSAQLKILVSSAQGKFGPSSASSAQLKFSKICNPSLASCFRRRFLSSPRFASKHDYIGPTKQHYYFIKKTLRSTWVSSRHKSHLYQVLSAFRSKSTSSAMHTC